MKPYQINNIDNDSYFLFLGSQSRAHYLAKFFFQSRNKVKAISYLAFLKPLFFKKSMVVIESSRLLRFFAKLFSIEEIPLAIETEVQKRNLKSNSEYRREVRKLTTEQYQYRISYSNQDLISFYHDLYLPYVHGRHEKASMPVSLKKLLKEFKKQGHLLQVIKNNQIVAGAILQTPKSKAKIYISGVLDNTNTSTCRFATYHYSIEWLLEQGYPAISLGWSYSFIQDGVNKFKKKWAANIKRFHHLSFLIVNNDKSIKTGDAYNRREKQRSLI